MLIFPATVTTIGNAPTMKLWQQTSMNMADGLVFETTTSILFFLQSRRTSFL
jgi:hypothetical protein